MELHQVSESANHFIKELHDIEQGDDDAIDRITGLFTDNAELSNPMIQREGGPRAGRDQIREFWRDYRAAFEEIHSEFSNVTAGERSAGLFWRSTGTHANGEPVAYDGVSLLEFDESGKIARFKGYFDSREIEIPATGG